MAVCRCLWIAAWFLWSSCGTLAFQAASLRTGEDSGDGHQQWLRRSSQEEGPPLPPHFVEDDQLRRPWSGRLERSIDFQAYFEGSGDAPTSYDDYHIQHAVTTVRNHDTTSPVAPSPSTSDENLVRSSIPYLGPSSTISVFSSSHHFGYDYILPSSSEAFIEPHPSLSTPWSKIESRTVFEESSLHTPVTTPIHLNVVSYDTDSIYEHISLSPTPTLDVEADAVTRVTEWSTDTSILLDTLVASPDWTGDGGGSVSSLELVPKGETGYLPRTSPTMATLSFVAVEPTGTDHAVEDTGETGGATEGPDDLSATISSSGPETGTAATFSADNSDTVSQDSSSLLNHVSEAAATSSTFSRSEARTGGTEDRVTPVQEESTDTTPFPTTLSNRTEATTVSPTGTPTHEREGTSSAFPHTSESAKASAEPLTVTPRPEINSSSVSTSSAEASLAESTAEESGPAVASNKTRSRGGKNFPLHMTGTDRYVPTIPSTASKATPTLDVRLQPGVPNSSAPALDSTTGPSPTQRSSVPGAAESALRINSTTPPMIYISSVASSLGSETRFASRFDGTPTTFRFASVVPSTAAAPSPVPSDTNFWDRFRVPTKASETTMWLLTTASRWLTSAPEPPAWTTPQPLLPVPPSTAVPQLGVSVPQSAPPPHGALNENDKYWIRTVLRMKDVDQTEFEKLVSQLAFVYEKAFAQSRSGRRGRRSIGRSTSLHVIHLAMDYKDRLMSLVYTLSRNGKLVPAEVAVDTMSVVNDTDMSNLLGYEVVTKAEPYVVSHGRSKAPVPLTWIVIGVLAGILVFVVVCLLLYCKCCRPKYPDGVRDVESVRSFGKQNRKKVFESSPPHLGIMREKSYKDVFTSPIHFPSALPMETEKPSPRDRKAKNLSEYYVNEAYEPDTDLKVQSAAEISPHVRKDQSGTNEILEAQVDPVPLARRDPNEAPLPLPRKSLTRTTQPISDSDTSLESSISTPSTARAGISPPDSATTSLLQDEDSTGTSPSYEDIKEARKQLDEMKRRISGVLDDTVTKPGLRSSQERKRVSTSATLERQASSFRSRRRSCGRPTGVLARTRSADDLDSSTEPPTAESEAEAPQMRDADTQTTADLPMAKPRIVWSIYKTNTAVPQSSPTETKPTQEEWRLPERAATLPDSTTAPVGLREPINSVVRAIRGELRKFNATHPKPNGESFA